MKPPAIPERVLSALIPDPDVRDAVVGDFAEEWARRVTAHETDAADRWYWRHAMQSVPHLLRDWPSAAGWRRASAAVIGGVAMRVVLIVAENLVSFAGRLVDGASGAQSNFVGPASVLAVCACAAGAGALTVAIRRRSSPVAFLVVVALLTVLVDVQFRPLGGSTPIPALTFARIMQALALLAGAWLGGAGRFPAAASA